MLSDYSMIILYVLCKKSICNSPIVVEAMQNLFGWLKNKLNCITKVYATFFLSVSSSCLGANASYQKNQSQAGGQPLGYVLENDHFI